MNRFHNCLCWAWAWTVCAALFGCSSNSTDTAPGATGGDQGLVSGTGGITPTTGGSPNTGGSTTGGVVISGGITLPTGGADLTGGLLTTGGNSQTGGVASAGGALQTGGDTGTGGSNSASAWYACDDDSLTYDATVIESGGTWTVQRGSSNSYTGSSMEEAIVAAFASLDSSRTSKQSVLVRGDGTVDANSQLRIPSQTIVNVCGTINVTGSATGSDRSPLYARGATDIDIPNVTITGVPQYAMFFRETNNVHLGKVVMQLDASAGRGLRIDHSSSSSPGKPMYENYQIDYVYVSGSGGHGVETYGINNITISEFVGENTGDCGLLLNYTTNAEVGSVNCMGCAGGTTYAAFRIANQAGNVNDDGTYPAGNIHVGEINASGGGRGIFCVSASGGLTVDRFNIDNVGASPEIFIENCYNVTLGVESGTLTGGQARIGYNSGNGDPSSNVIFENMTLNNATILESPCDWGDLGNRAVNITGGMVNMCTN